MNSTSGLAGCLRFGGPSDLVKATLVPVESQNSWMTVSMTNLSKKFLGAMMETTRSPF